MTLSFSDLPVSLIHISAVLAAGITVVKHEAQLDLAIKPKVLIGRSEKGKVIWVTDTLEDSQDYMRPCQK